MIKKKFTAKQQAFVDEYPLDKNATKAAIRAGYSEKTAYSQGQRLLKKVEIKAAIDRKLQQAADKVDVSIERVVARYAQIAFADIDLTDVKPADQIKALGDLMRHLGGFSNDSINLKASESLIKLLQAATNMGHVLPKDAEKRERLHS